MVKTGENDIQKGNGRKKKGKVQEKIGRKSRAGIYDTHWHEEQAS